MFTYQDLLNVKDEDEARMAFVRAVIAAHKRSDAYEMAVTAGEYDKRRNTTILSYQKLLYTMSGRTVPDNWSACYKMTSNFFDFFVTQENQYLMGNGVTWQEESTADRLGDDFNSQLQLLGKKALVGGVAFGFWNKDHLEVFGLSEFAPLYDEENGALMAGVRFWQIDKEKPLRGTLYEMDGYTEYIWDSKGGRVLSPKRAYIVHTRASEVDGTEIYDGENYPTFPIVPLWGSLKKQSELVGLQEQIDAYDLIKSGFANDVDDCSQIYWVLKNAGGMDEVDLVQFLDRMRTVHAVNLDNDVSAEAHTMDVPYSARETLLVRLRDDLFEHAMAFDPKKLASGGSVVTAAIRAAYAPLDSKTDEYEYCVKDFIKNLFVVAGIENDSPTFTRSVIINEQERIQTVVSAANYLDEEYVTRKILAFLGDGDLADDIISKREEEEAQRSQEQAAQLAQLQGQQAGEGAEGEEDEGEEEEGGQPAGIVAQALRGRQNA